MRSKLSSTVTRLLADVPNIRIALIAHGDYCDYNNYVTKIVDFTNDVSTLVEFANGVERTSGGDCPEVEGNHGNLFCLKEI